METVLFENAWLSVINRNGYIFTHTKNSVVYVLPYRRPKRGAYLLARVEVCPAHDLHHERYAITGQCEPGTDPLQVATVELQEEAGIVAQPHRTDQPSSEAVIALGSAEQRPSVPL